MAKSKQAKLEGDGFVAQGEYRNGSKALKSLIAESLQIGEVALVATKNYKYILFFKPVNQQ